MLSFNVKVKLVKLWVYSLEQIEPFLSTSQSIYRIAYMYCKQLSNHKKSKFDVTEITVTVSDYIPYWSEKVYWIMFWTTPGRRIIFSSVLRKLHSTCDGWFHVLSRLSTSWNSTLSFFFSDSPYETPTFSPAPKLPPPLNSRMICVFIKRLENVCVCCQQN